VKVTEHNTIACRGDVRPEGHRENVSGPWYLRIGTRSQPDIVKRWTTKSGDPDFTQVYFCFEQTNKEDNFTLIRVMFLRGGTKKPSFVAGCTFHRTRIRKRPEEIIELRIKRRYGSSLPHPIPIGRYTGSCMYDVDGGFAVFTLQAVTLRAEPKPPEPKTIITPGDAEYDVTFRDAQKTLSRVDGLGGRGANAGGLRDGELPDSLPAGSGGEGVGRSVWTPGDR
jgi:hypothetical protein